MIWLRRALCCLVLLPITAAADWLETPDLHARVAAGELRRSPSVCRSYPG